MGFSDDLRLKLKDLIGKGRMFPNKKRMADSLDVDPSQLNRFLSGERGLNVDSIGRILEKLDGKIIFPGDSSNSTRDLCFMDPKMSAPAGAEPELNPGDFIAVPLANSQDAAIPGLISENKVEGYILVWRNHDCLRDRTNLVAMRITEQDLSMVPALHPGDVIIVDRDDKDSNASGSLMLVREPGPDGRTLVRRVLLRQLENDLELIFYSDNNKEFPPMIHLLEKDYQGDIRRAIAGKLVFGWGDMTLK